MKAVIIAGGKGTRLKDSINYLPKILAPLKENYTILDRQMKFLAKNKVNSVILSLGHGANKVVEHIKEKKYNCEYLIENEPLGTGGWLNIIPNINENFLVFNGDNMMDFDILDFLMCHEKKQPVATIAVIEINDISDSGSVVIENGKIKEFKEKTGEHKKGFINSGFYMFSPEIFDNIKKEGYISLEKEVFPKLAEEGELQAYPIKNVKWAAPDTPERLEEARKTF